MVHKSFRKMKEPSRQHRFFVVATRSKRHARATLQQALTRCEQGGQCFLQLNPRRFVTGENSGSPKC